MRANVIYTFTECVTGSFMFTGNPQTVCSWSAVHSVTLNAMGYCVLKATLTEILEVDSKALET